MGDPGGPSTSAPRALDGAEEDAALSRAEVLSREEVIRRRSRRLKQLSRLYREHYWALMEELRAKYRDYYWVYGKSPFSEDEAQRDARGRSRIEGTGDAVNGGGFNDGRLGWQGFEPRVGHELGLGFGEDFKRCAVGGCKTKAMALSRFCHSHILSDSKQKLYKGCNYAIKSAPTGPVLCGKPILRSTIPSLCPLHFQKAEKHVARALKKAGLNGSSSRKLPPKFHVIVAEYVRQIQAKRRATRRTTVDKVEIKEENRS